MSFEVIIVGAGPAGISCAIQLQRSNIVFLLIDGADVGGLLKNAFLVENLPGVDPISGPGLVEKLLGNLRRFEIGVTPGRVGGVGFCEKEGCLWVDQEGEKLWTKYLVIASGTQPKRLPSFEITNRTFYEAWEMRGIRNSRVAIMGSGEAAYDSALTSAQNNNQVTIFTKKAKVRLTEALVRRVRANERITLRIEEPIIEAFQVGQTLSVRTASDEHAFDYLLISIGRTPNVSFLEPGLLEYPNVYLCGDVRGGRLGQCAIAMGEGLKVATQILSMQG